MFLFSPPVNAEAKSRKSGHVRLDRRRHQTRAVRRARRIFQHDRNAGKQLFAPERAHAAFRLAQMRAQSRHHAGQILHRRGKFFRRRVRKVVYMPVVLEGPLAATQT